MYLNLDAVMMRKAYATALGVAAAGGKDDLAPAYFSAVTETKEEADQLRWKTNSERALATAKAMRGRR